MRPTCPGEIRGTVGKKARAILHLEWQHDTRARRARAGSPVSGTWGRVKLHTVLQGGHTHPGLQTDLRLFREVPGGVLAGRLRGAWVGSQAQFYDRLFLGGMDTARGFPTHSLSATGGDTWQVTSSLEYRSTILGNKDGAKVVGLLFLDSGAGGSENDDDPYPGIAASAGFGVRARARWLGWYGVDIGFPLTERPLDQRFQVNASIGWSF
jgi:hemolysin activation/secretion protein